MAQFQLQIAELIQQSLLIKGENFGSKWLKLLLSKILEFPTIALRSGLVTLDF